MILTYRQITRHGPAIDSACGVMPCPKLGSPSICAAQAGIQSLSGTELAFPCLVRLPGQRLDTLPAIGPGDDLPYRALFEAVRSTGLLSNCIARLNSIVSMHHAVRHQGGAGILPVYLGGSDPDLLQCGEPIAALDTDLWLLTDPDLRNTARIRVVRDYFGTCSMLRARLK